MQINGFVWDSAESYLRGVNITETSHAPDRRPRHPLHSLLIGVLGLESLALVGAGVFLIFEVLVAPADSLASALALTVFVFIAAVWVAALAVGAWRGQAWIRSGAIVVQMLLVALAIGSFQGILPRPDIGWLLLLPAIVVLTLLFTRPVLAALKRADS
jgi:hypothetical protein